MTKLLGEWKRAAVVFLVCVTTAIVSPAQTLTTLASFDGTNGLSPVGSLVQGFDGNFYGTTTNGGDAISDGGTVFSVTPSGTVTSLHIFCAQTNCPDGAAPQAGLVLATDGNLYGTTSIGGGKNPRCGNGCGTVFEITPSGTLTTLYNFCSKPNCTDGGIPDSALTQALDGNFYGTTSQGGGSGRKGTVFKITPSGELTTLHRFCAQPNCADGADPSAGLIEGADGDLYGTTTQGGLGWGTIFKFGRGALTTLHSFDSTDGAYPDAALVQAAGGNFYGTTNGCGGSCINFGTVYMLTPGGELEATSFQGYDGAHPSASLVQATNGDLYGTATHGGRGRSPNCVLGGIDLGCGAIFYFGPGQVLTNLHSFCLQPNCPDGYEPGGLLQSTDGNFYGTTSGGGSNNGGTVFVLSVGLGPFVKTLPTSGAVGASVIILGTSLTGATGVSFNGTSAAFTVVSGSEITTTVPSGATTGRVQVTTPSGALLSNVVFRVTP